MSNVQDRIQVAMDNLNRIRDLYGEEKFQYAAKHAARMIWANAGPEDQPAIREAFKGVVDVDNLDKEPAPKYPNMPPDAAMLNAIKQQMPGIQTQAQLNIVLAAFDALRVTLNSTFLGDKEQETKGRDALFKSLEAAKTATELSSKLGHVPEAATSKAAEDFKKAPAEFEEQDTMEGLLSEVEALPTLEELNEWYVVNRSRIDRVKTQGYRNQLLDTIRSKKLSFS